MKKYLTQKELLEKTGIQFYQLEYLIKKGEVPVIKSGSGVPRKYPVESLKLIEDWKKSKGYYD